MYDHRKQRQIDDHTKFIEDILAINCKDNWYKEIDKGMEDEIEKHLLDGDFELGDVKESRLQKMSHKDDDEKRKKGDKLGEIGNQYQRFTDHQAKLIARLFRTYIDPRDTEQNTTILFVLIGTVVETLSVPAP